MDLEPVFLPEFCLYIERFHGATKVERLWRELTADGAEMTTMVADSLALQRRRTASTSSQQATRTIPRRAHHNGVRPVARHALNAPKCVGALTRDSSISATLTKIMPLRRKPRPEKSHRIEAIRDVQRSALQVALEARRALSDSARCEARKARLEAWKAETTLPGAIAVTGDSLAALLPFDALPGLGADILRRGVPGEVITELRARMDEILDRDPALMVLQIGTNDALRGVKAASITDCHAELLGYCRMRRPRVGLLVCALPPITPWRVAPRTVIEVNAELRRGTETAGAVFVDTFSPLATDRGTPRAGMSRDGVHLTPAGYREVVRVVISECWTSHKPLKVIGADS